MGDRFSQFFIGPLIGTGDETTIPFFLGSNLSSIKQKLSSDSLGGLIRKQ
jgi:hypothetical protein